MMKKSLRAQTDGGAHSGEVQSEHAQGEAKLQKLTYAGCKIHMSFYNFQVRRKGAKSCSKGKGGPHFPARLENQHHPVGHLEKAAIWSYLCKGCQLQ